MCWYARLITFESSPQIDEPVHGGDHDRAADHVTDRDRDANKKFPHVSSGKSAAVLPIEAQNDSGAPALMNNPIGMKYTFAMLCSNPAATKSAIGGMIVKTLSTVSRAL